MQSQKKVSNKDCLVQFVVQIEELYGMEYISYNVHQLTHLADAITKWGPLWSHAAYIYEECIVLSCLVLSLTIFAPKFGCIVNSSSPSVTVLYT